MFNKLVLAGFAAGAAAIATPAAAATITFFGGQSGLTSGQTIYADFDTVFGSVTQTGTGGVVTGSVSGQYADPAVAPGDAYYYVSGGGSALFGFGTGVGSFGFDLGSADSYNTLRVGFSDGTFQDFIGAALNIPNLADGNQASDLTNGRVTVFGNGRRITSAEFISGQPSFEFDTIGIGAVPEPTTWALFILGFGVIGASLRRRSGAVAATKAKLNFA